MTYISAIRAMFYNTVNCFKQGFTGKVDRNRRKIYIGDTVSGIGTIGKEDDVYGIILNDDVFKPFTEPHFWNMFNPNNSYLFVTIE